MLHVSPFGTIASADRLGFWKLKCVNLRFWWFWIQFSLLGDFLYGFSVSNRAQWPLNIHYFITRIFKTVARIITAVTCGNNRPVLTSHSIFSQIPKDRLAGLASSKFKLAMEQLPSMWSFSCGSIIQQRSQFAKFWHQKCERTKHAFLLCLLSVLRAHYVPQINDPELPFEGWTIPRSLNGLPSLTLLLKFLRAKRHLSRSDFCLFCRRDVIRCFPCGVGRKSDKEKVLGNSKYYKHPKIKQNVFPLLFQIVQNGRGMRLLSYNLRSCLVSATVYFFLRWIEGFG